MSPDTGTSDLSGESEHRPMTDTTPPVSLDSPPIYRLQRVERRYMKGEPLKNVVQTAI